MAGNQRVSKKVRYRFHIFIKADPPWNQLATYHYHYHHRIIHTREIFIIQLNSVHCSNSSLLIYCHNNIQKVVKSIADFEVLGMYFGSYYCACNLWCNSLIDCSYLEIMRLLFYHRGTFQTIPFMLFLVSCGLSWRIVRTVTNSTSLESYHLHTSLVQPIPCFAWSFCEPPLQDRVFLPKPSIAIIYSIPHRATWVTSSR